MCAKKKNAPNIRDCRMIILGVSKEIVHGTM